MQHPLSVCTKHSVFSFSIPPTTLSDRLIVVYVTNQHWVNWICKVTPNLSYSINVVEWNHKVAENRNTHVSEMAENCTIVIVDSYIPLLVVLNFDTIEKIFINTTNVISSKYWTSVNLVTNNQYSHA